MGSVVAVIHRPSPWLLLTFLTTRNIMAMPHSD